MEFWGHLWRELSKAAADMRDEDTFVWRELNMLANRAGWVFEDWRDFGATDGCTLGSRIAYGDCKRAMHQTAQDIAAEAEKLARESAIQFYNQ